MIVPVLVADVLALGAFALVLGSLVALWRWRQDRRRVPEAIVLGSSWRRLCARIPVALITLCVGGVWGAWMAKTWTNVVVVHDGDDGPYVERGVHLGAYHPFGEAGYHQVVWVVNDSSHVVRLVHAEYYVDVGESLPISSTTRDDLAPGRTTACERIDFIGPEESLPRAIPNKSLRGWRGNYDFRLWLTWDR